MQVKEIKSEGLKYEMEVTLTAKEIDKHVDERLAEIAKTAKMPGFRPGKVPMPVLKQRYGKSVMGEVLEKAVNDTTQKVFEDKKIKPALQPKIEVVSFDEGSDLTYKMEVESLPEIKVQDYKKYELEKPVAKVADKEIDEALERVAANNADAQPISGKRASKDGDILLINFKGRTADDNVEHEGMAAEGHQLKLGSGQFIPGFEEQLVGKKAGETVEVKVSFPEQYGAADLAGRDAIFDVEIREIQEEKTPEINDEFAKRLGMDDLAALRKAITEQIQKEYDQVSRMRLKRVLLDKLDDEHDFDLPQGMVDLEYDSILRQVKQERQQQAQEGEPELEEGEEEELKAIAERRVRLGLILSEVGVANNIQISDQELQRAVIEEAQKYKGQEAQVFEYFRNNRQALEGLRAPLFEEKVVDFIVEQIKVKEKEVSAEDLVKEDEGPYQRKGAKPKSGAKKSSAKKEPAKKSAAKKTSAKKSGTKKTGTKG